MNETGIPAEMSTGVEILPDPKNRRVNIVKSFLRRLFGISPSMGPDKVIASHMEEAIDESDESKVNFLSPDQKEELFKEDILAGLGLTEYMELWRTGSPYYCAHITRQGVRDHGALESHQNGMGECADGFVGILNDGKKLRSTFGVMGLKDISEKSVLAFMESGGVLAAKNIEDARSIFSKLMEVSRVRAYKYGDKTAIHFAEGMVSDHFYGGEQGNEIFVVFPADFIASQTAFRFNGFDGSERGFVNQIKGKEEDKWNDVWVWPSGGNGLNVDAGVVFLPESCQVDPVTGSKYKTEMVRGDDGIERRVVSINNDLVERVPRWWKESSIRIRDEALKIRREDPQESEKRIKRLETFIMNELSNGLGIVVRGIYDFEELFDMAYVVFVLNGSTDFSEYEELYDDTEKARKLIGAMGRLNERAEKTISSRQYWESYFEQNPDKRPAHIVWYQGDPSTAVNNFLANHGIVPTKTEDSLLGFEKNLVRDVAIDPRSNMGKEEVYQIFEKLIQAHFKSV